MPLIRRLKQWLIAAEKSMAIASLFLLLAIALIQIVARNFFDYGFAQLDMISRHLVLYLAFAGAALVTENDGHIKIDVLAAFMSRGLKRKLARPLLLLAALICALFAWHAARFWQEEWHYATDTERWETLLALILPVGFGMLSLHFLLCGLAGQVGSDLEAA